jgi:hypothetical protein
MTPDSLGLDASSICSMAIARAPIRFAGSF